jgi:hypothetical protein
MCLAGVTPQQTCWTLCGGGAWMAGVAAHAVQGRGGPVAVQLGLLRTQRDRAASVRLFRLVGEVVYAIEAGVFHPNPGWQCRDCQFRSSCWAWK